MKSNSQDTNDLYVSRVKIQNRWISGFYQTIRSYTIWITLFVFFMTPWLTWHGRQAVLFDVSSRQFFLFGITFWPQDFYLLALLLISSALALIVITNLAGRLWCGYTCPQTVWTKCFMWMEYMIEGDRNQRLKLDKTPTAFATISRRTLKHTAWMIFSLLTAMTFVAYFVPLDDVISFQLHWLAWGAILFFTAATYLNAGWMREQLCLYICPYARFQSVMFDRHTLVISYDAKRGEPRGSRKRGGEHAGLGDCINCQLCVQVCPTGIDIRDGLQMACIGCAACIDACDSVMDKMNYPRGLVRYDTEHHLEGGEFKLLRPRLIASTLLLLSIVAALAWFLFARIPLQLNVTHDHLRLYRMTASGAIENSYVLSISNMEQTQNNYLITLDSPKPVNYVGPTKISLLPGETQLVPVTLSVMPGVFSEMSTSITFHVLNQANNKIQQQSSSHFFVPNH